jgi:hypothetical protein
LLLLIPLLLTLIHTRRRTIHSTHIIIMVEQLNLQIWDSRLEIRDLMNDGVRLWPIRGYWKILMLMLMVLVLITG